MNLKTLALIFAFALATLQCQQGEQMVTIETDFGDMVVKLYDSTPTHRDNFLKLIKEGFYDDLLFHRIIKQFMIQGGDPNSRGADHNTPLGSGGPGYQIDAEIGAYHFKGALSAARMPDQVNPEKKSSGSQFFVVQGYQVPDQELDRWEQQKGIHYNDADRERYRTDGGYPFLDNDYTVFGEVVQGLDIIDKIADQETAAADRPVNDIKMKIRIGQ